MADIEGSSPSARRRARPKRRDERETVRERLAAQRQASGPARAARSHEEMFRRIAVTLEGANTPIETWEVHAEFMRLVQRLDWAALRQTIDSKAEKLRRFDLVVKRNAYAYNSLSEPGPRHLELAAQAVVDEFAETDPTDAPKLIRKWIALALPACLSGRGRPKDSTYGKHDCYAAALAKTSLAMSSGDIKKSLARITVGRTGGAKKKRT